MTFAEKLRELRTGAGLSEAKLAELSGISFGAIHNYGLGIRTPTFPAVVKVAKALGVTCETFAVCEDIVGGTKTGGAKKTPGDNPKKRAGPARKGK
jgi:transcriptional regulator with XRE-family HTH domain